MRECVCACVRAEEREREKEREREGCEREGETYLTYNDKFGPRQDDWRGVVPSRQDILDFMVKSGDLKSCDMKWSSEISQTMKRAPAFLRTSELKIAINQLFLL